MHELHGPDNCGFYCQLRYEIRPYGHCAPTYVEFYHGMHDPENIDTGPGKPSPEFGGMFELPGFASDSDQGPGKISPESGDMLAVSDFVSDFYPGPGVPLLQSGVSLNMPTFAGVDDVSQVPHFASVSDSGPGTISPKFGNMSAMSDFVGDSCSRELA